MARRGRGRCGRLDCHACTSPGQSDRAGVTAAAGPRLGMRAHRRRLGPRRTFARDGIAHIEVRPADLDEDQASRLEQAIEASDGVHWVAYNGALGRVIVSYDPARTTLRDLVAAVERAENV